MFSINGKEVHLYHFSPETLCLYFDKTGFDCLQLSPDYGIIQFPKKIVNWISVIPYYMPILNFLTQLKPLPCHASRFSKYMKKFIKQCYLYVRQWVLNFLSIFLSRKAFSTENLYDEIKKALFIRIDRIGDLILSTPALKAFKQNFPDSELIRPCQQNQSPGLIEPAIY